MSKFAPVFLPDDRGLRDRASQTFLRHANGCMRSGFFYALFKGEASTVEMVRGVAVHETLERAAKAAMDNAERRCPPEVAKAILEEVLIEQPVPFEEHDFMRESVARWANEWQVDPDGVVSIERMFVLDVLGWEVRMKIDYAELRDGARRIYIADYKSGRGAPTQEDVSRKRPDGTLMAKSFQLVLYALGLAFGVPVRFEDCARCAGAEERGCPACDGKGYVEIREPVGVGRTVVDFDVEFVYPGIQSYDKDDKPIMLRRSMSLTRLELEEYRGSLAALLARVRDTEKTGDWPAVLSDQACTECPARSQCPIPVELRDHRGTINTIEEAAEAAERLSWEKKDFAARRKELKASSKLLGPIVFGNGMVAREAPRQKTLIPKRDEMLVAAERAARFGEPFDRDDWVKVTTHTEFVDEQLSEDEIAALAAGTERDHG